VRCRFLLVTLTLTLTLACTSNNSGPGFDFNTTATSNSGSETGDGDGNPIGDVCDPSSDTACELVGGICCSDDPAALLLQDLAAQVTPQYEGIGGEGMPLYSAFNNPLSRWGWCMAPAADGLSEVYAQGCPVPCNPTWDASDIDEICGPSRVCCQTIELEPEDCVLDPDAGSFGCWRPVTGNDIMGLGGLDATNWASTAHATHQDPSGLGCETFTSSIPSALLDDNGLAQQDVLIACYRRLGVADVRGLCLPNSTVCPFADPDYVDACEQRNLTELRDGCD
jgi:hypothetical protein